MYKPINGLTHIMIYNCLIVIVEYFVDVVDLNRLQNMLEMEIKEVDVGSFIRPYILLLITKIKVYI
jgi:hypothetical protein